MSIQVTIGTAPCSWGVWWPDGTPSRTPYNVFLDQAAQAGYKTLELGPVGYLPTDVEQLRDELDSRGLSICGGTACYEFLKASSFADVRKDVDDLCKRLLAFDVHYMMSMDGTAFAPGEKDKLTEAKKRTFGIFAEMGRYCRETYGVEVLMHPERRSARRPHCSGFSGKTHRQDSLSAFQECIPRYSPAGTGRRSCPGRSSTG